MAVAANENLSNKMQSLEMRVSKEGRWKETLSLSLITNQRLTFVSSSWWDDVEKQQSCNQRFVSQQPTSI